MKKGKGKQKQKLKVCFYLLQTSPANKQILKKKNELKDEVIAKVKQPGNMILFSKFLISTPPYFVDAMDDFESESPSR